MPRQRKKHICYENGNTAADFVSKPEDHYRRIYYEALDLIIEFITDHFNQPGYELYSNLHRTIAFESSQTWDYEELKSVAELYQSDLHIEDLKIQLKTLSRQLPDSDRSFSDIMEYLQTLSNPAHSIYSEDITLINLFLVMPASNGTNKRSFTAL